MFKKDISSAKRIAKYGNVKKAKVSAIAFSKSGKIIASSYNRRTTIKNGKYTEHAEEALIRKLNKLKAFSRYKGISILVLRVNTFGLVMAKPCKRCSTLLRKYKVSVVYTNNKGVIKKW